MKDQQQAPATTPAQAEGQEAASEEFEQERGNAFAQEQLTGQENPEAEAPGAGGALTEAQLDEQRPAGTAIPAATRTALIAKLEAAAESKAVLDQIKSKKGDLNIDVRWSTKGGYQSKEKIYIDRRLDEAAWFSTLAHECVHLKAYLYGEQGKVKSQSKEDYVATQMTEEIEAHSVTYVTLMQAGDLTNSATGYTDFIKWLGEKHPNLLASEADPADEAFKFVEIKALAKPWLENKYKNEWVGSSSGKNYYQKWEAHWDANNPAPAGG